MLLLLSHYDMCDSATPSTVACQLPLSSSLLEFVQIHVHWVGAI